MDSTDSTSYQTASSGLQAPQSNNPFLQSTQGSVTAPTTGHSLADATKDGFSGSSSTGLNGASGSSGSGSTSLGSSSYQSSISPSSSSTNTDNTAAKDLGSNAAALGNSVMASEVSFQLIYYRTAPSMTCKHTCPTILVRVLVALWSCLSGSLVRGQEPSRVWIHPSDSDRRSPQ